MMKTMAMRMRASRGARPRLPLIGLRERRGDQVAPPRCDSFVGLSERRPGQPGGFGMEDQVIVALLVCY